MQNGKKSWCFHNLWYYNCPLVWHINIFWELKQNQKHKNEIYNQNQSHFNLNIYLNQRIIRPLLSRSRLISTIENERDKTNLICTELLVYKQWLSDIWNENLFLLIILCVITLERLVNVTYSNSHLYGWFPIRAMCLLTPLKISTSISPVFWNSTDTLAYIINFNTVQFKVIYLFVN